MTHDQWHDAGRHFVVLHSWEDAHTLHADGEDRPSQELMLVINASATSVMFNFPQGPEREEYHCAITSAAEGELALEPMEDNGHLQAVIPAHTFTIYTADSHWVA